MGNLYKIKQIIIIILILIITGGIFMSVQYNKKDNKKVEVNPDNKVIDTIPQETRSLCYYRSDTTKSNFLDKAWLKVNVTGDKVTGEFQNLPAESDSKVGTFEGTMGPLDQKSMSGEAIVWWNSRAEGMEVKEELIIKWGDGSATVGFGEMVDRGDGVYLYKDKSNLYYIKAMDQMDCINLDEKLFVEKYIKDNIATIATNKAILGGTWYVISTNINPATKTGEVTYEDGHVQSKATLTYEYAKDSNIVKIVKFEPRK